MWNVTSDDVQQAKDRLERRRAAVEARYAADKQALDAELAMIETLERVAAEFADKHHREDADSAAETLSAAEIGMNNGSEDSSARDILKPGSRWRLHLGNRPNDPEGAVGGLPSAPI